MLMVIGTSGCDILISRNQVPVEGFCGICPDSAIPGYYGYEAGQACMGDHFQWFMENCLPSVCHEEAAKRDFHEVNERLRNSTDKANRYANLLMPVNANIGWISYALVAILGAILGINNLAGVTIGTVITFVGLNRSFTNPITQVSQQINFVVNAAAGAQRVFDLMDQEPEADEGYVELVNAKEDRNGQLTETPERTSLWAWKHPHKAEGTVTYAKLEGGVDF